MAARAPDPAAAAGAAAGLRWVNDRMAGIRRLRRGAGFSYRSADGRPLHVC